MKFARLRVMADCFTSGVWGDTPNGESRHVMVDHEALGISSELAAQFDSWTKRYRNHKEATFDVRVFNDEGWHLAQLLQRHVGDGTQVVHAAELREGGICADREVVDSSSLPEGWSLVEAGSSTLALELDREVGPGHPLFGVRAWAFARRFDRDDVLFAIEHPTHPWAVVHLTWAIARERAQWPAATLCEDWTRFLRCSGENAP
jgi:hypothetical protein